MRHDMNWFERLVAGVKTREARYGTTSYFKRDDWHGLAFEEYGEWSEREVALWRKLVKPGDTVVDVGAHIGAHTLALASLVGPTGWVHSFEPQEGPLALLDRNVGQNGLKGRVNVWSCALGNKDDKKNWMFYDRPNPFYSGNIGAVEMAYDGNSRRVLVSTLDETAMREGNTPASFVKADVEGMELNVLEGGELAIRRHRPVLYVECDRVGKKRNLIRFLTAHAYRILWHLPPLYNPANFAGNKTDVFRGVVSVNMLALPPNRPAPDDPFLYGMHQVELRDDGIRIHRL